MTSGRPDACSIASLTLGEPLAGGASTAQGYLLLEHGGPWAARAVEDFAPHGDTLGQWLVGTLKPLGVTPLLARRHRARPGVPNRPVVALAALTPHGGNGARTTVDDVQQLREWEFAALIETLRDGALPTGWEPLPTLFGVCTNGRRDACCAELGRPLAAVLDGLAPEQTWELSHFGGHRFAGNVLVLPEGVAYGRVEPDDALDLVSLAAEHRLLVRAMRGRAALPPPLQVAEIALRQAVPADGARDVVLVDSSTGGDRTTSSWAVGSATWRVVVDGSPSGAGQPRRASCEADPTPAPPRYTVVEVTDTAAAGRGAAGWDDAHAAATMPTEPNPLVREAIEGLRPGTALDVACGSGRHSLWLAEQGWSVTGVDFSRVALAAARAETSRRGAGVDWQLGDARVWEPAEPVDLVLMAFVHLPSVLERAFGWLRPGGRLVVVGHALRNLTEGVGGPSDPRLLHDPSQLRRVAESAGLDVLRCDEVDRWTPDGTAIDAVLVAQRPA